MGYHRYPTQKLIKSYLKFKLGIIVAGWKANEINVHVVFENAFNLTIFQKAPLKVDSETHKFNPV